MSASDAGSPFPAGLPSRMFEAGTEWLRAEGSATDVVLSSRVRLARNLAGLPFVNKAGQGDLRLVLEAARPAIERASLGDRDVWIDLHEATEIERALLLERHLISSQLAKGKPAPKSSAAEWPRAVCFGLPGERASVMINEEDHIRLQCIRSGMALREAWQDADTIDDRLESHVDLAFSPRLGYLTACPTNVGTGVRFSVMLHLPGLRMSGEIDKVKRAASDMSLAVRGFYGEGSEASGDFYQLSNQTTLGKSELLLLEELDGRIIPEVIEYERQARHALLTKRRAQIEDTVHRAYGVLRHARLLRTEEAMKLLSVVRLGICMDLLSQSWLGDVQTLMLLIQPAHLQRTCGREMGQDERRQARADIVRHRLAEK